MKRLLFFISLVFTASSLFANSPNQQNSEIEKFFNAWKDFLTQYDEILENYEASSPKAQAMEKKVLFSYKNMHEAFSHLYVQSSRMYKNQLDSGVKKGAPMVKGLESRIENLKTIGRRMKPSLDIDQQKELLQWMAENNFPKNIDASSQNIGDVRQKPGEVSVKNHNPGDRMVKAINGVEFAFRWCPPGTFMMGSPDWEQGHESDETQHQVTLTKGFWMLETEVSQKQWIAIMNANLSKFNKDHNHPVENVSWDDCQLFCRKCMELGVPVHLPTEAQWEYACRAGSTEAFSGNLDEMAWYLSNSGKTTHSVGVKKPNSWGLFDMIGNVWEWCEDWYGEYPSGHVTDPVGSSGGSCRVVRGKAKGDPADSCRYADRNYVEPFKRLKGTIGFRVILEP